MVVTPDNSTLVVSESFAGRLTAFDIDADGGLSNRRVWAEGIGPDSITMDADGAIWTHSADTRTHTGRAADPAGECVRVFEGGEIRERIVLDAPGSPAPFADRTAACCSCWPHSGRAPATSRT
jgi:sugar lactone lactonase YvrE